MIGHKVKNSTGEYLRYYQCGNFHYKGSAICNSNLIRADYAEDYVFKKLGELTSNSSILKAIINKVNNKIITYKKPLENQLESIQIQIKKATENIEKYFRLFEDDKLPSDIIKNKLDTLSVELKTLQSHKNELETELAKPTIKEVSFDQLHHILSSFSKVFSKVLPAQQKDLLHSIVNKITINPSNNIKERSIKDIELFFDTLHTPNFVLTYGTVHPS